MRQKALWIIALVYVVLMVAVVGGLYQGRAWTRGHLADSQAKAEWQTFRDDVANSVEDAPVRRRVPKSVEPPALVLLRDHFVVCLIISCVMVSALFGTFALFIYGSLSSGAEPEVEDQD